MFAHDLYHSQINILGMLSTYIEKTERSLRLVGVVAPTPRRAIPQIFNLQFRLVRVGIDSLKNASNLTYLPKKPRNDS